MNFVRKIKTNTSFNSGQASKKKKFWRWLLLVLGILVIIAAAFAAYLYATGSKIFDSSVSRSSLLKALTGGSATFQDDRINILIMGRGGENHPGGLLTDSIMVVSIRQSDKKVSMLSIPRDLYVPISGHGSGKVNSAFADGYNNYLTKQCKSKNTSGCVDEALAAGANLSRETVANVLGISIPYYFIADFNGFTQLVDKLGGIDVYVDRAIYDPLYPDAAMKGYSPFSIKAGQHHLDGATALKYARSRETTSDFDRAARQQKIITAIKDRALSAGFLTNPKQLLDIFNIISDHIRTNLSATEIKALAEMAKDITSSSIISEVLDDSADGPLVSDSSSGTYYLKPKNNSYDTIKNIVKNIFDTTPAKFSAKLEVLNGSVTNGQATKVSAVLKGLGYEVVNTATAKQIYPETTIYDYTNGKYSPDIDYLRDRYDATVEQKTKPSGSNADLTLIIGNDYK